ncbi:MAG: hypothetical protein WCD57_10700, partial [Acidobacteriaceae bacterium]
YWGVVVGALVRWKRARWWLALALAVNLADVVSGGMHWHGNLPWFRFLLGLMLGLGVGAVLFLPDGVRPVRFAVQRNVS